jgi:hypothetical protein
VTNNKKPSLVGFRPTEEEMKKIADLLEFYKITVPVMGEKYTQSDILRIALDALHFEKVADPLAKKADYENR